MDIKYPSLFKILSPEEILEYQQYAQENDPPSLASWELYHPVCREVWIARGIMPLMPLHTP